MSSKLARHAYEKLIAENLEWLMQQPRTLEREHIAAILARSADHEYGDGSACTWTEDSNGTYHTTCGNAFAFVDAGPVENGMRWCGYCGKTLTVERYASDDARKDDER